MDKNENAEFDAGEMSQLVAAARDGDAAAHSEICRQVQSHLDTMANKQLDQGLRRKVNPSDIVQATMVRMVSGFEDFRGSTSAEFYGWLNTILKNEVHTTRRDLNRDRRDIRRERELTTSDSVGGFQHASPEASPTEKSLQQEKLARFRRVIEQLPDDYARVIELRSIQELPFAQVAEQMDRSVDAVSKLWGRALVKLQQELAKIDDSFS